MLLIKKSEDDSILYKIFINLHFSIVTSLALDIKSASRVILTTKLYTVIIYNM